MKSPDNPLHLETREPLQLRLAPRCGAKTRTGKPCHSPIVGGKTRCRMHGGAQGSGAPRGTRNGNYSHGDFTERAMRQRREAADHLRKVRATLADL